MEHLGALTWLFWAFCLGVGLLLLRADKNDLGNLKWISPKLFMGLAFLFMNILPPLNTLITGLTYRGIVFERETNLMLLASSLSGISFLAGWRLVSGRFAGSSRRLRRYPSYFYVKRALFILPFMAISFILYVLDVNRSEWMPIYIFGLTSFIAGSVMIAIAFVRARKPEVRAALVACGLTVVGIFFWLAAHQGSRLMFLLLILPLLALILLRSKHHGLIISLAFWAIFLIFFIFYGRARTVILKLAGDTQVELVQYLPRGINDIYERLMLHGDLDAFENGTLVLSLIPRKADYFYGSTFASLLILPIPRAWWPAKPAASVSALLADHYYFPNSNFAISLQAETYANFGWPGIILVFGLYGLLARKVLEGGIRDSENPEKWTQIALFSGYLILVMRGSFHSMTSYYLMVLFWILGSKIFCRLSFAGRRSSRVVATRQGGGL